MLTSNGTIASDSFRLADIMEPWEVIREALMVQHDDLWQRLAKR